MATILSCSIHIMYNSQPFRKVGCVVHRSSHSIKAHSSSRGDEQPQSSKNMSSKAQRSFRPRSPLKMSGDYSGEWTSEWITTLSKLQLSDIVVEDGDKDAEVLVKFSMEQQTETGFFVGGTAYTCFSSICRGCGCLYRREIAAPFKAWFMPPRRRREGGLRVIGGDPSVIFLKPHNVDDLRSLIHDAIRLSASVRETCSEECGRWPKQWEFESTDDDKKTYNSTWSKLLELKKRL